MEYSFASIKGPVREENQDAVFVQQIGNNFFSLVCDGMGGHWGGKFASSISIKVFEETIKTQYFEYLHTHPILEDEVFAISLVKNTIHQIIKKMKSFAKGDSQKSDMGTTFSLLILNFAQKKGMLVNIGDSRCFQINQTLNLFQLLPDQNVLNYLMRMNYTPEEIQQNSQNLKALTSSLGIRKNVKVDYRFFDLQNVNYLFQATDGLYDFVHASDVTRILSQATNNETKLQNLIQLALRNRSNDNLTGVLIKL